MKKVTSNKGFTLVELIIVIAILAIIMLIAIPNFSGIQQRMQVRSDKATAAQIGKAVRVWFTDYTTDKTLLDAATASKPSDLKVPTATGSVELVEYSALDGIDGYITKDHRADSLLDADGKAYTDAADENSAGGYYGVFLTADSTNASAKIAVAITTKGATSGISGAEYTAAAGETPAFASAEVNYDGKTSESVTGGVAYVEP